jgi:FkbM family methyltransferase
VTEAAKQLLVRSLWVAIGRRNLVRLGRFLGNEGRLDVANSPETSGEYVVQQRVIGKATPNGSTRNGGAVDDLVACDVGANVGRWTMAFLATAQSSGRRAVIHAFEPCDGTREVLTKNLRGRGLETLVRVNAIALSSKKEQRSFFSAGATLGINSLYPIPDRAPVEQSSSIVETETLDRYCAANGIDHLHFVKVDTEGHDLEVLYGGRAMFARGAVDVAQFEYNHRWIDARHFLRDAFEYFAPLAYHVGKITPRGVEFYDAWDPELETFREGNYLAIKRSLINTFDCVRWWKTS